MNPPISTYPAPATNTWLPRVGFTKKAKAQYHLSLKVNTLRMLIERNSNDKITITLSSHIDSFKLQRLIDYIKYLELTSRTKANQSDADKLAEEVNASWWEKNRGSFNG